MKSYYNCVGKQVRVVETPGSATAHLLGDRGTVLAVECLPEHEGGTFLKVELTTHQVVDWHHECFEEIE